jgi:uncharacterized membrane protein HdeD (DUF308 family)
MRPHWGWLTALGIGLVLEGILALVVPWIFTLGSVLLFAGFVLFGAATAFVSVFFSSGWKTALLHLLDAVLGVVVGAWIVRRPDLGAASLTAIIASFFLVGGLFRAIAASLIRFPEWGWAVLSGVVSTICGVLIARDLGFSATWVLGTLLGVELISRGWAMVRIAAAGRALSRTGAAGMVFAA